MSFPKSRRPTGLLAELMRKKSFGEKTTSDDFQGGIISWTPERALDGEVSIKHRLGGVPKGIVLAGGTTPLNFSVSADQRSRWTRDKIYLTPVEWQPYLVAAGTIAAASSSVAVTLARALGYPASRVAFSFGILANQAAPTAGLDPLKGTLRRGGSPIGVAPYDDVLVETLSSQTVGGASLQFVMTVLVNPGVEDRYHFQVY